MKNNDMKTTPVGFDRISDTEEWRYTVVTDDSDAAAIPCLNAVRYILRDGAWHGDGHSYGVEMKHGVDAAAIEDAKVRTREAIKMWALTDATTTQRGN